MIDKSHMSIQINKASVINCNLSVYCSYSVSEQINFDRFLGSLKL